MSAASAMDVIVWLYQEGFISMDIARIAINSADVHQEAESLLMVAIELEDDFERRLALYLGGDKEALWR